MLAVCRLVPRATDFIPEKARLGIRHDRHMFERCNTRSVVPVRCRNSSVSDKLALTWKEDDCVPSLTSNCTEEIYRRRAIELREEVRRVLHKTMLEGRVLEQLELVDAVQRLGVARHFANEIKCILDFVYESYMNYEELIAFTEDLYATSLSFRLFRQHGYKIDAGVFNNFMVENGKLKAGLHEDMARALSLYEASFLSYENESILEGLRKSTTKFLREKLKNTGSDRYIYSLASHSLEIPLHWRVPMIDARWYIDLYQRKPRGMNPTLLELAKMDFSVVQASLREDLTYALRWWDNTGLGENVIFARDMMIENFLWAVGMNFDPENWYARKMCTKIVTLITIIDDLYDSYGTLNELKIFTDAVERWDISAIEVLPNQIKMCFVGIHNTVNEIADDAQKSGRQHMIPYLKKAWADLCNAYLVEANWHNDRYTPSFHEYLDNAWVSVGAPLLLTHAVLSTNHATEKELETLATSTSIFRNSGLIVRLTNDLGKTTEKEEISGDVPKSRECYMLETGASEEAAREHIEGLVRNIWKKMNQERVTATGFSRDFTDIAMNLARMAHFMYQHGDGHNILDSWTIARVRLLLVNTIHP